MYASTGLSIGEMVIFAMRFVGCSVSGSVLGVELRSRVVNVKRIVKEWIYLIRPIYKCRIHFNLIEDFYNHPLLKNFKTKFIVPRTEICMNYIEF